MFRVFVGWLVGLAFSCLCLGSLWNSFRGQDRSRTEEHSGRKARERLNNLNRIKEIYDSHDASYDITLL